MKSWGFTYKTHMVWVKDKIGTGYYARNQHEDLLIGEKGDMPVSKEENRFSSVFHSERTNEHSKKPELVYELIEQMYPNRKYLELFSRRNKKEKEERSKKSNWKYWGNEI